MRGLYTIDPDRVAAYVRWSTEEQSEGTTLEVQVEACRHFILAQGWRWRDDLLFVDDGHSGGTLDRPALAALRKGIQEGQVGGVVVFRLDRLSRSVMDTVNLVLGEWDGLCFIRSTREPVDTANPAGKMFFYMLASYAEWERNVIRERTLAGRIKRAQQGKVQNTRAYGYRIGDTPGSSEIYPAEAAIVRRIYDEYLEGHGYHAIAARLNADGILSRRGGRWQWQAVGKILRNPVYIGVAEFGRSTELPKAMRAKLGRRRIVFETPQYARVEGAVAPIIKPSVWAKVQAARSARRPRTGRYPVGKEYLLSGLAHCTCGATVRGDQRGRQGRIYRYYRCSRNGDGCDAALTPADVTEQAVVEQVQAVFAPAQRLALLANWQQHLQQMQTDTRAELAGLREQLEQLAARRGRLDDDYDRGVLTGPLYNRRLQELADRQRTLRDRQGALESRLSRSQAVPLDTLDPALSRLDLWGHLGVVQRREFLRHVVAEVQMYRPKQRRGGRGRFDPKELQIHLAIRTPSPVATGTVLAVPSAR